MTSGFNFRSLRGIKEASESWAGIMAKILIVEDDETLAYFVKEGLIKNNHAVDVVTNGEDGLYWLVHENYALAIVDWDLPKLSGIELCQRYRSSGGAIPILMLTGKSGANDIVQGLDSGADDYLAKPFEMAPLLARIRAILRRPANLSRPVLTFGDLTLDPVAATISVHGCEVDLTPKEYGLLEFLMRNPNRICSAQNILENVWPSDSTTSPESIRSMVQRLRSKLENAGAREGAHIRSVYGMGYKLE